MKKFLSVTLLFLFVIVSCSKSEDNESASSIKINERNTQINVGEIFQFTYHSTSSDIGTNTLNWMTSDIKTARIDKNGLMEALNDGEVKVKVATSSMPYISDEVSVKILPIEAESISIDSIANVYYDGYKCFSVKYYPEKSKKKDIVWTSSNENIVMISSYGCLTIKNTGKATITAKVSGTNMSSSCNVSINHRNPNRQSVQCIAKTQAGSRCKRMTTNLNARCWQHQ